jgi:hypothetical protein
VLEMTVVLSKSRCLEAAARTVEVAWSRPDALANDAGITDSALPPADAASGGARRA